MIEIDEEFLKKENVLKSDFEEATIQIKKYTYERNEAIRKLNKLYASIDEFRGWETL